MIIFIRYLSSTCVLCKLLAEYYNMSLSKCVICIGTSICGWN
jgi:hypothetical protein